MSRAGAKAQPRMTTQASDTTLHADRPALPSAGKTSPQATHGIGICSPPMWSPGFRQIIDRLPPSPISPSPARGKASIVCGTY